jgi:hypothetical protein
MTDANAAARETCEYYLGKESVASNEVFDA